MPLRRRNHHGGKLSADYGGATISKGLIGSGVEFDDPVTPVHRNDGLVLLTGKDLARGSQGAVHDFRCAAADARCLLRRMG